MDLFFIFLNGRVIYLMIINGIEINDEEENININTNKMILSLLAVVFHHALMTSPSLFYHSLLLLYYQYSTRSPIYLVIRNKKVIAFIHGRTGHHSNFLPLISNLAPQLLDYDMRPLDLGYNFNSSIDEDVSKVKYALESCYDCDISLIGLSKGGLTSLRYLSTTNSNQIKKIITISSPLMGTKITKLICSDSITHKELGYESEITKTLANYRYNIPIYHIVPKWDHIIIPTTTALYSNTQPSNIHYYNGHNSHSGIIFSNEISNVIANWIQS